MWRGLTHDWKHSSLSSLPRPAVHERRSDLHLSFYCSKLLANSTQLRRVVSANRSVDVSNLALSPEPHASCIGPWAWFFQANDTLHRSISKGHFVPLLQLFPTWLAILRHGNGEKSIHQVDQLYQGWTACSADPTVGAGFSLQKNMLARRGGARLESYRAGTGSCSCSCSSGYDWLGNGQS
jgi:hypothetical protein